MKFYLCLMGVLAGIYLVLVAILAIRNPPADKSGTAASSVTTEAGVAEGTDLPVIRPESSGEDKEQETAPTVQAEQAAGREKLQEQKKDETEKYGRGKNRYTTFDAQDIFTKVNVKIVNKKELRSVVGAGLDIVKSYLNAYASHNEIVATKCRMLAHQYIGHYGDRIEIYMRFNDEEKTLATVIYEPANSTNSSHVDVVPCPYTIKEIKKLKQK